MELAGANTELEEKVPSAYTLQHASDANLGPNPLDRKQVLRLEEQNLLLVGSEDVSIDALTLADAVLQNAALEDLESASHLLGELSLEGRNVDGATLEVTPIKQRPNAVLDDGTPPKAKRGLKVGKRRDLFSK